MSASRTHTPPSLRPEGEPEDGAGEVREGAYWVSKESEALMSWEMIREITIGDDLDKLVRHPDCFAAYQAWAAPIRKKWGSLEGYIRSYRLGWDDSDEVVIAAARAARDHRSSDDATLLECFEDDMVERMAKVIPNDWPYAVPTGSGHFVVWCRLPIVHPSLLSDSASPFAPGPARDRLYELVANDGIRGVTGEAHPSLVYGLHAVQQLVEGGPDHLPIIVHQAQDHDGRSKPAALHDVDSLATKASEIVALAQRWAGRHAASYVTQVWPPEDWDTAWFCNPPHLRTVPGLSHFHVIARRKHPTR